MKRPAVPAPVAGIDIGSNAMRLVVGQRLPDGAPELLASLREPVRLGRDAFGDGRITEETAGRFLAALHRFRASIDRFGVVTVRAVATSALREARNAARLVERARWLYGLEIEVISAEEEARLVHLAVTRALELRDRCALTIDIGGGSVEIALSVAGELVALESLRVGTVRLLSLLGAEGEPPERQHRLMREYVGATRRWLERQIGGHQVEVCVGVGGNVEALGELRVQLLGKSDRSFVRRAELDALYERLAALDYGQRVARLGLRPDRADVILPAVIVLQSVMRLADAERLSIPNVGVKEGLLLDLLAEAEPGEVRASQRRRAVWNAALRVGRKFDFDEAHGTAVARLAGALFDQTAPLHGLDGEHRLLLEVAALLHDVGHFVGNSGHHKHSQYLLQVTPIAGLSGPQMALVANVARYHRKAFPSERHKPYRCLAPRDRRAVARLAALLRLASALDAEQAGRVREVALEVGREEVVVRLAGEGDLLLETWALLERRDLFERTFERALRVEGRLS